MSAINTINAINAIEDLKLKLEALETAYESTKKTYHQQKESLTQQLATMIRQQNPLVYSIHAQSRPKSSFYGSMYHDLCFYTTAEKAYAAMSIQNSESDHHTWEYMVCVKKSEEVPTSSLINIDNKPPYEYPYVGE